MINRVSRTLKQRDRTVCRQRPARLGRGLKRTHYRKSLVDINSLDESCPFVSDVTHVKEHFGKQLTLISEIPVLDIGIAKMGLNRGHIVNL